MPVKFIGKYSALFLQDYLTGGPLLIALCKKILEYEREREAIEITTMNGSEVGHVLGLKRGVVTFNGLSIFKEDGDTGWNDEDLRQFFENGNLLSCTIVDDPEDGNSRTIAFTAYCVRYRIVRNTLEAANFDIELRISEPGPITGPPCPIIETEISIFSFSLSFEGIPGLEYTFVLGYETVTVTEAPYTAEFAGLESGTEYTVGVSVFDYDTGLTTVCADIVVTTIAVIMGSGFPGADVDEACDEVNTAIDFYYTGSLIVGRTLYSDAGLTTPITAAFIKVDGIVYELTAGQIVDIVGECGGGGGTPIELRVSEFEFEICGATPATYYLDGPTFEVGARIYLDEDLTMPLLGSFFASPPTSEIFNISDATGDILSTTGNFC